MLSKSLGSCNIDLKQSNKQLNDRLSAVVPENTAMQAQVSKLNKEVDRLSNYSRGLEQKVHVTAGLQGQVQSYKSMQPF